MRKSPVEKLLNRHKHLVHSENVKVISHVQRVQDDWFINTIMVENITVAFKYKRKQQYKSLQGQRVNVTYYPGNELVAGFDIEIMTVVRIKSI